MFKIEPETEPDMPPQCTPKNMNPAKILALTLDDSDANVNAHVWHSPWKPK